MTTFLKAKLNKIGNQSQIYNYNVTAHVNEEKPHFWKQKKQGWQHPSNRSWTNHIVRQTNINKCRVTIS